METKLISRRKLILASFTALPVFALPASTLAAGLSRAGAVSAVKAKSVVSNFDKFGSISLRIESMDPRVSASSKVDILSAPFNKAVSFRQSTKIPSPYYFTADVEQSVANSNGDVTISLYDEQGNDLGSITTASGGTATFTEQQLRFQIGSS